MPKRIAMTAVLRASSIALGATLVLALAASVPAGASPAAASAQPQASRYRQVDLGTFGGESSVAMAMNDRGAVVGRAQAADGQLYAFRFTPR